MQQKSDDSHNCPATSRRIPKRTVTILVLLLMVPCLAFVIYIVLPWMRVRQLSFGLSPIQVEELLGQPDDVFQSKSQMQSSRLSAYSFHTVLTEQDQAVPIWIGFPMTNSKETLSLDDLPDDFDSAHWYELSVAMGVLVCYRENVTAVYVGGLD